MSEKDKEMLRIKFDIVHFIATQQLAFTNYPALCELEKKHGVNVGVSYLNQNAGKTFCHFIAESKRVELREKNFQNRYFCLFLWMVLPILLTLMMKCF